MREKYCSPGELVDSAPKVILLASPVRGSKLDLGCNRTFSAFGMFAFRFCGCPQLRDSRQGGLDFND